ncbi:dihydrofolate reductase [Glaciihabitans tibetensis]|uniref:Dihydrofolate reductase n=1 Tax=Glaciihabitans tibetensis TaxID=1266600 RepID=A0A2T0VEB4_9MICO|nr:dihydrofolate reductase family protein [Glaciihabitans tibetensis]PRY68480.1 dihydrofolate reductase [Glaciihabitans tibetensis]
MRKVIYAYLVSVDGYVTGPDGSFDWAEPDPEVHQHFNDLEATLDTHFYGRNMWEVMSSFWPDAGNNPDAPAVEVEYAEAWNRVEHIVFSSTLTEVGHGATLATGSPASIIAELKARPGKNIDVGGATLANSLLAEGLVDEVMLYICPFLIGGGKTMFSPLDHTVGLRLVNSRVFDSGIVHLHYERKS